MWPFLAAGCAYLLGAIPTGILVSRCCTGIDIRAHGSGNVGATNVARMIGTGAGALVLALDVAKGLLAVLCLPWLLGLLMGATLPLKWVLQCGVAVVIGHDWSCFTRLTGGKGIATSAGVLASIAPVTLAIAAIVWGLVFAWRRIVSLASLAAAVAVPIAFWLQGYARMWIEIGLLLACLAIFRHKSNIQKLLRGTEPMFTLSKRSGRKKIGSRPWP